VYEFDLGAWSRQITTTSAAAQTWFDRGLNWTYAYNQEEAVACFRKALEHDAECAMAWWGVAYANGPFYNRPWIRFTDSEIGETLPDCYSAAQAAAARLDRVTGAERALIAAIPIRFQSVGVTDRDTLNGWHEEFTAAMRLAHADYPDDLDIAALFAEAAVTCTPRQLWNLNTGEPNPSAHTVEVLAVLEHANALIQSSGQRHPGVPHMAIHALEMSPFPERALEAADSLCGQLPDGGHLEHMPGHIYVLCGDYAKCVEQSILAVAADDKYVAYAGPDNFYTTARCHDLHLYMYAAMLAGQFAPALTAADRICATADVGLIKSSAPFMASILDGYSAMRTHVLVRFGKWRQLTLEPAPVSPEVTPVCAAMHLYGKGIAHSALGEIDQAERTYDAFTHAVQRIPKESVLLNNTCEDVMAVGEAMLNGELEYRKHNFDAAFEKLREAVRRDDSLNYTEPWAWMHPPRHALGALLAEQGRFDEAQATFRADLGDDVSVPRCCQHPNNVWALHGLSECLERAGDTAESLAVQKRLEAAQARTDITITSSCFCRGAR
jgi:tetratricopeptide (TPR) repeat protein